MANPRFCVSLHDDLNQELFDLGWFPKYVAEEHHARVDDLAAVEIRINGLHDDYDAYDMSMASLEAAGRDVLDQAFATRVLLAVEHRPLPVSRVRSHRGFLSRRGQYSQGKFLEREVSVEGSLTFFVAIAEMSKESWSDCFQVARDPSQACILSSGVPELHVGEQIIDKAITCLTTKNVVNIDYMRLVPEFCQGAVAITSVGLDTRGEFVNLRSFAQKDVCRGLFDVAKEFDQRQIP